MNYKEFSRKNIHYLVEFNFLTDTKSADNTPRFIFILKSYSNVQCDSKAPSLSCL